MPSLFKFKNITGRNLLSYDAIKNCNIYGRFRLCGNSCHIALGTSVNSTFIKKEFISRSIFNVFQVFFSYLSQLAQSLSVYRIFKFCQTKLNLAEDRRRYKQRSPYCDYRSVISWTLALRSAADQSELQLCPDSGLYYSTKTKNKEQRNNKRKRTLPLNHSFGWVKINSILCLLW